MGYPFVSSCVLETIRLTHSQLALIDTNWQQDLDFHQSLNLLRSGHESWNHTACANTFYKKMLNTTQTKV